MSTSVALPRSSSGSTKSEVRVSDPLVILLPASAWADNRLLWHCDSKATRLGVICLLTFGSPGVSERVRAVSIRLLGKIFVDDFFTYLGEPRSMFSDALFELNGG
eukprot:32708-Eustigmatos_ZCMA.PRE.1